MCHLATRCVVPRPDLDPGRLTKQRLTVNVYVCYFKHFNACKRRHLATETSPKTKGNGPTLGFTQCFKPLNARLALVLPVSNCPRNLFNGLQHNDRECNRYHWPSALGSKERIKSLQRVWQWPGSSSISPYLGCSIVNEYMTAYSMAC